ncbi:unnamed protein product [Mytilus edulis]|uniref:Uncharacterized protein n=1 Tax=Mytilus edulis TaxID=6550 RepID=A0A8S3VI08_MYTED|nr:unnamed protein product [Mytilus edulis]
MTDLLKKKAVTAEMTVNMRKTNNASVEDTIHKAISSLENTMTDRLANHFQSVAAISTPSRNKQQTDNSTSAYNNQQMCFNPFQIPICINQYSSHRCSIHKQLNTLSKTSNHRTADQIMLINRMNPVKAVVSLVSQGHYALLSKRYAIIVRPKYILFLYALSELWRWDKAIGNTNRDTGLS